MSSLLIWVSLAGQQYDWVSGRPPLLVALGVALCVAASGSSAGCASRSCRCGCSRDRTVVLAVIASVAVGIAMFGTTVFLSQYMQIARGKSPTESGLLTIPMVVGLFVASTSSGGSSRRTGVYKRGCCSARRCSRSASR